MSPNQAQALLPNLYCSVLWRPLKWKQFSEFENTKTKYILFIENPSFLIFYEWKLWKYFGVKLHNFGTVASDQAFTHDDMLNQTIFMPDWKQNSYILCNCICVSMTTIAQPIQPYPTESGILLKNLMYTNTFLIWLDLHMNGQKSPFFIIKFNFL